MIMKILNYKDLEVNKDDDFLYLRFINILQNVRLVQGGSALDATLHRHPRILNYCKAKQLSQIRDLESEYFCDDGRLNGFAIQNYHTLVVPSSQKRGFTTN